MRKPKPPISQRRRARQKKALDVAVAHYGSMTALSRVMDVSYQSVQGWYKAAGVPVERCVRIEKLLKGRVKCEQLNEDYAELTDRPYKDAVW